MGTAYLSLKLRGGREREKLPPSNLFTNHTILNKGRGEEEDDRSGRMIRDVEI